MTPAEYTQLKAFAKIDGAYLGITWIASFALSLVGLSVPGWSIAGMMLAVLSPVLAAVRLRKFRDVAREGVISFRRAMAYYALTFLYASLLLALAQYVYFAYIDGGYIVRAYTSLFSMPEIAESLRASGISEQQMNEYIRMLGQAEPIHIALNVLSMNVLVGIILSIPVAAILKRNAPAAPIRHDKL